MAKDIVKGIGYTIAAQLFSLVFVFFCAFFLKNLFLKIIIGLCSVFILSGLCINYSYYTAQRDIGKSFKNIKIKLKPVLMGISASVPPLIMWIVLLFSKMELIPNILPVYKLSNEYFLLITAFMCNVQDAASLDLSAMAVLLAACFIPLLTVTATYFIVYRKNSTIY